MYGIPKDVERWSELKRWERRELGQALRRQGLSYREIAAIIPVSKGTLSHWCRDIELTAEQEARLSAIRPDLTSVRRLGARRRREAIERANELRSNARAEVSRLACDPLWVAGVVAYWAEGSKSHNDVSLANSDPEMIKLFMKWAVTHLAVAPEDFTIKLHLHDGQDEADRIVFWSKRTGIPRDSFGKTFIKREGTGHRKNILHQGTATVRVRRSSDKLRRVLGWIEGYSELANLR